MQDDLERALETLLGESVELTGAGRTDRGVHAWAQVASYPGHPASLPGLNALLRGDVSVAASARVAEGFDARRDARSRTYCFRLLARRRPDPFERGRALFWPARIDRDALHVCAEALVGRHDFTAFTPTETEHVRFEREVFRAEWRDHGDLLEFWIEAESFLRHMNRALVGTMLQVAGRRRRFEDFTGLLEGRPRAEAGPTAAPHGLYLAAVSYDPGPA